MTPRRTGAENDVSILGIVAYSDSHFALGGCPLADGGRAGSGVELCACGVDGWGDGWALRRRVQPRGRRDGDRPRYAGRPDDRAARHERPRRRGGRERHRHPGAHRGQPRLPLGAGCHDRPDADGRLRRGERHQRSGAGAHAIVRRIIRGEDVHLVAPGDDRPAGPGVRHQRPRRGVARERLVEARDRHPDHVARARSLGQCERARQRRPRVRHRVAVPRPRWRPPAAGRRLRVA
jgi:hypothetical protein